VRRSCLVFTSFEKARKFRLPSKSGIILTFDVEKKYSFDDGPLGGGRQRPRNQSTTTFPPTDTRSCGKCRIFSTFRSSVKGIFVDIPLGSGVPITLPYLPAPLDYHSFNKSKAFSGGRPTRAVEKWSRQGGAEEEVYDDDDNGGGGCYIDGRAWKKMYRPRRREIRGVFDKRPD